MYKIGWLTKIIPFQSCLFRTSDLTNPFNLNLSWNDFNNRKRFVWYLALINIKTYLWVNEPPYISCKQNVVILRMDLAQPCIILTQLHFIPHKKPHITYDFLMQTMKMLILYSAYFYVFSIWKWVFLSNERKTIDRLMFFR